MSETYYKEIVERLSGTIKNKMEGFEVVNYPPGIDLFKGSYISVLFESDSLMRGQIPNGVINIRVVMVGDVGYKNYLKWLEISDKLVDVIHSNWDEGLPYVKGKYVKSVAGDGGFLYPKMGVEILVQVEYFRDMRAL